MGLCRPIFELVIKLGTNHIHADIVLSIVDRVRISGGFLEVLSFSQFNFSKYMYVHFALINFISSPCHCMIMNDRLSQVFNFIGQRLTGDTLSTTFSILNQNLNNGRMIKV